MATKQIAWNTGGGNIILTYQGQGNGTIVVTSDNNDGAARSQVITVETLDGTKSVNLTVSQTACPVPIGTVLNYAYTGSYQEVELPAGQYKLQCWGAQGGSNGTNSSYGITAQSGGKGGYSEGVITLTQKTTLRVYVGGQGSSSAGGYNGGGSTTETAQYNSGNEFGYSKMGGGGGATDIRLSDGALLSRMIVAGGGSGGAMCYKAVTTTTTTWETLGQAPGSVRWSSAASGQSDLFYDIQFYPGTATGLEVGATYRITGISGTPTSVSYEYPSKGSWKTINLDSDGGFTVTSEMHSTADANTAFLRVTGAEYAVGTRITYTIEQKNTTSSTTTSTDSQTGYVGGGTSGGGYSSTYQGKQNTAGSGGSFGTGANQTATNYRYCSGAGGGGWYGGGGGQKSDSSMSYCKYSGGGSGFVNIASNAQYRPTGYTGLELDSGETKDGNTSFPNTAGTGNETGHSGNGYAKITRLS